tara:strand:+ start:2129 stop:2524 length:396 start_codon:yes stop_codon:yes gene_type:complete
MLKTKCILESKEESDGLRISVMSRHTLEDGVTPDLRITSSSYDLRMPSLAPPSQLLRDYYKWGLSWDKFEKKYLEYVNKPWIVNEIKKLASRSLNNDITLLCIEESSEYCHRRLLAEECKKYESSLVLDVR